MTKDLASVVAVEQAKVSEALERLRDSLNKVDLTTLPYMETYCLFSDMTDAMDDQWRTLQELESNHD